MSPTPIGYPQRDEAQAQRRQGLSVLEAALVYAEMGRRVHPCRPEDKRPLTRWGTAATTNPDTIKGWWLSRPDALIAVCTGDGLVVVDDDRGLAEPDPDLADTLTVRTRSRGWHHWYSTTERIGNSVNLLTGIDVRGHGGYVIAPPSLGWEWHNPGAKIEPLPDWLTSAGVWKPHLAERRLGFEPANLVAEGGRNDYVARFAGFAIRIADDQDEPWTSVDDIVRLCIDHNRDVCRPPLDDNEVRRTVHSIWRRHNREV